MEKDKRYGLVRFTPEAIRRISDCFATILDDQAKKRELSMSLNVGLKNESWDHDSEEEFFSDIRKETWSYRFAKWIDRFALRIQCYEEHSTISVGAPSRKAIELVFEAIEGTIDSCRIKEIKKPEPPRSPPIIFVGHGKSSAWRDLKDHLSDLHGCNIEAYETGVRAGHGIRDVLEGMSKRASLALLVLTAEDADAAGNLHARENVIHELGLFQGSLGFSKAIALVEEGTNEFSNLHGIAQLRFRKDRIKETFGDVVAVLRREFGPF